MIRAIEPYRTALRVSATNILFKNTNEQFRIIENFGKMINSISVPIQIICNSTKLNANDWKLKIHNQSYYNFLKEKIEENVIVNKEFKIIVCHHNDGMVESNVKVIKNCLRGCGLEFEGYEDVTLPEIIPDMKTKYIKLDNMYYRSMYVKNWPYGCSYGWLSDIYNGEKDVDVSMLINPVPKVLALKYLNKKLVQNTSSSVVEEDENEIDGDQFDENIASAIRMREELFQNNGKFFFMSYYVTVKAKSLHQVNRDFDDVKTVLEGLGIEVNSCFLREDDGYKATKPYVIDFLHKEYNFTTGSLKNFFPFITSNIIDKGGVLIGENLLNSSLVFLDPYKYASALMFVIGQVGAGKTFLIQLFLLRLLYMGVQVDIWDKIGEYMPLYKIARNMPNLKIHKYTTTVEYRQELKKYVKEMDNNLNTLQPRFLVIDEFWEYLKDEEIANLIDYIALTGRKKYQGLCVITQMIEHMTKDDRAIAIVKNASIKALMKMETSEVRLVQKIIGLTENEVSMLVSAQYEGILFAGSKHIQFKALASKEDHDLLTTDPRKRLENNNLQIIKGGLSNVG